MSDKYKYAFTVGVVRIGLFLVCVFLLIHLFVEPRRPPYFNPIIDALLALVAFAILGYVIGLLMWHFQRQVDSKSDRKK